GESAPAARSLALVSARLARWHAQDQGQERSQRRRAQALAAKRHRPRACRLHSFSPLAPWRHGARPQAARLQLRAAEENAPGRAALGAFREARGTEIDGCRGLVARYAQDQGAALGARQVERRKVRIAGGVWRKSQSGPGQPESRARQAGGHQRFAALRLAESRSFAAVQRSRCAAESYA